jgi:hypothetical protein
MDSYLRMHFLNLLALGFALLELREGDNVYAGMVRFALPELTGQGSYPAMRGQFG